MPFRDFARHRTSLMMGLLLLGLFMGGMEGLFVLVAKRMLEGAEWFFRGAPLLALTAIVSLRSLAQILAVRLELGSLFPWLQAGRNTLLETAVARDFPAYRNPWRNTLVTSVGAGLEDAGLGILAGLRCLAALAHVLVLAPALLLFSWKLAAGALALALPALLVSRLRAGVLAREGRLWSDSRAALSVETERFAEGLESHAGNGRLGAATARMGGGFEAHARHSRSWETAKAVFPPALEWFFFLALAALALLAASAGGSAGASAGVGGAAGLLPFGALLLLMYRPIREWARHYPVYLLGAQAWESVNRVRGELESFPIRGPRPASASGSLVLEGVGFGYHAGYPGRDGLHERQGRVIDGLDLEIEPSALTWITGRNGAGKSTLLKLLAGIESPREGRILLPGPWREPCFAYLPQKAFLDSDWRDWAQAYGEAHPGEWKTLDRILGLEPILARAGEDLQGLSGGERQRLCLARTLASPAPYLLLDEPTTWLAAGDRERILGDLLAFWRACGPAGFDRGGALVSHEPFIGEFCSRTVRMDRDPVGVRR